MKLLWGDNWEQNSFAKRVFGKKFKNEMSPLQEQRVNSVLESCLETEGGNCFGIRCLTIEVTWVLKSSKRDLKRSGENTSGWLIFQSRFIASLPL